MISASVTFSPYSNTPSALSKSQAQQGEVEAGKQATPDLAGENKSVPESGPAKQDPGKTAQDQKLIDELKRIDRAVRAHEQAHLAAAGGLAVSGATYGYRRGPDGQQYAVSGEVSIDVSPGRTPQETVGKAERIQAAALAPADPSAQDRSVASSAAQMKLQAQQELAQEKLAAAKSEGNASEPTSASAQKTNEAADASPPVTTVHRGIASYRANSTAAEAPGRQINYTA